MERPLPDVKAPVLLQLLVPPSEGVFVYPSELPWDLERERVGPMRAKLVTRVLLGDLRGWKQRRSEVIQARIALSPKRSLRTLVGEGHEAELGPGWLERAVPRFGQMVDGMMQSANPRPAREQPVAGGLALRAVKQAWVRMDPMG